MFATAGSAVCTVVSFGDSSGISTLSNVNEVAFVTSGALFDRANTFTTESLPNFVSPSELLRPFSSRAESVHSLHTSKGSCAMQLSMHNRDYAVRKLITMIAERDAAILERNSAIAEKTSACEERDAALLLRDVAYNDRDSAVEERDSAVEERDAAVAALEIAVNARTYVEKRAPAKDSKLFQTFSMAKNCTIVGAFQTPPFASTRFSTCVQEPSDLCRTGDSKELQGGPPRKRKLIVKSTLDRTLRAKRSCRSPQPGHRVELRDGNETEYFNGPNSDARIDSIRYPIPHCSCTGVRQQCYRWGSGGWQSSCCTTMISMYPLPMNPSKRRSRLAGRKMSAGAFEKLLEKLGSEGINVNYPVDLKDHWAKHGTNRYVTLR